MDTLTSAELSEEVIRTLVGSIGLVLAIPVTTLIAVLVVKATGISAAGAGASGPGAAGKAVGVADDGGHTLADDVEDTGALAAAALEERSRRTAVEPAVLPTEEAGTRRGRRADRG